MAKPAPRRQRTRKGLLVLSFLLFPLIMNYFSPYVIIDGAAQGTASGSMVVFGLLFLSALFLGRLWCGWACPAGGLGEICFSINSQPVRSRRLGWGKWLVWVPWMGVIIWAAASAGGLRTVDFFMSTENGISVSGQPDRPILFAYVIYYIVIGLFAGLSVWLGRRAGCHAFCWMAPFMIVGRKLRGSLKWAALRLEADPRKCSGCQTCTSNCPMSLPVTRMVQTGAMENADCILCGSCIDGCPKQAIRFAFSVGGQTWQDALPLKTPAPAGQAQP